MRIRASASNLLYTFRAVRTERPNTLLISLGCRSANFDEARLRRLLDPSIKDGKLKPSIPPPDGYDCTISRIRANIVLTDSTNESAIIPARRFLSILPPLPPPAPAPTPTPKSSDPLPDYTFGPDRPPYWSQQAYQPKGFLIAHGDISALTIDDFVALKERKAALRPTYVCEVHLDDGGRQRIENVSSTGNGIHLLTQP